jgi:hypothetical protein
MGAGLAGGDGGAGGDSGGRSATAGCRRTAEALAVRMGVPEVRMLVSEP